MLLYICACTDGIISLFAGLAVISEVLRKLLPFRSRKPLQLYDTTAGYISLLQDYMIQIIQCNTFNPFTGVGTIWRQGSMEVGERVMGTEREHNTDDTNHFQ